MTALALVTAGPRSPTPIAVQVTAGDPLLQAGVENCLNDYPELMVVNSPVPGSVALLVTETVDEFAVSSAASTHPVVLVTTVFDAATADRARAAGAAVVVPRHEASPPQLVSAVMSASRSIVPPALDARERAVLSLLADGHETAEVARRLAYSVRTVTGIVHDITLRFHLRNRAHAVAHALREGLI
ncbi:LuxR C-terminal-related transcriptional regulator [Amycolatopsis sp. PS_44_ISF1]|uniref:LuxR C-terminal-related transcriptional regulator n=1 Tax=Amycolatopsis sp. PS_44_ISF1 TaxID=2974917 RepID=UPI0028DD78FB|nr:LuxR C-terminal-related transcriptional regulator [Amycolatopsis sp. PS_44_ISF1]MDT8912934.1 LuxR C-terminal-related transcriptional regulator [Amycolatopsis sp. PS_44_ISF1]